MALRNNRWVLLHHQVGELLGGRGNHYDLMVSPVEFGAAGSKPASPVLAKSGLEDPTSRDLPLLWTWAIPTNPLDQSPQLECSAERLPDHRRAYLDYEGPISGDRGRVHQVASGSYEVVSWSEAKIELRLRCVASVTASQAGPFSVSLNQQGQHWALTWSASD